MKLIYTLLLALAALPLGLAASAQAPDHKPWVSGYYLAEDQDTGPLAPAKIDFTAFSHLIHTSISPAAGGGIDPKNGITPAQSRAVLGPAHAAGCKVLVCLGNDPGTVHFRENIAAPLRAVFARNLVQFVIARGYDGIDIDFEPLEDRDVPDFEKFIPELRANMIAAKPGLLLTAAVATEPEMFARLQVQFDQINLMTYDLSGPWPGCETWYNAALYDGGQKFVSTGAPFNSVQGMVEQFTRAGVRKDALGIGLAFYGYTWTGASRPQQGIKGVTMDEGTGYSDIMDTQYRPERYHWDGRAHAPYLGIDSPDPKQRKFISYDDETLCAEKVAYVKRQQLGGMIIWQISQGYRASQPEGQKDKLLQAVKKAWLAP